MEHDKIYEDTWEEKKRVVAERRRVKNDALSTAFCYARYTMGMEELTNLDK